MSNRDDIEVKINRNWCKGCGICVAFCPKKVLALDNTNKVYMADRENCIKCGQCELRCPDYAIYLGGVSSNE
jgi:2-oxoglutarate ferredoxin oxidoreductase subunit delta